MRDRKTKVRLEELIKDTFQEWECDVSENTIAEIADHLLANGVMFEEDAFVQMRSAVEKIEEKLKDKLNKIEHPIARATMAMVIKDVLIPAIDEVREDEEQKLKGGDNDA